MITNAEFENLVVEKIFGNEDGNLQRNIIGRWFMEENVWFKHDGATRHKMKGNKYSGKEIENIIPFRNREYNSI